MKIVRSLRVNPATERPINERPIWRIEMSIRALLSLFAVASALLLGACTNVPTQQADAGPAWEHPDWDTQYGNAGN